MKILDTFSRISESLRIIEKIIFVDRMTIKIYKRHIYGHYEYDVYYSEIWYGNCSIFKEKYPTCVFNYVFEDIKRFLKSNLSDDNTYFVEDCIRNLKLLEDMLESYKEQRKIEEFQENDHDDLYVIKITGDRYD